MISAVCGVFFLMISCSGAAPVIDGLKWRLLYRDNGDQRYEELSLFLRVSDPDGPEDLAQLSVSAGNSGLIWYFPKSEWITESIEGVEWQGLPALIPLEDFRLPDTLYTIRLEDLAGRSDELTFRPDPNRPSADQVEWPGVSIDKQQLHLEGAYERGTLILRDEELKTLEVHDVRDGSRVSRGNAAWWELWISSEDTSGGYRLGPYRFSATGQAE